MTNNVIQVEQLAKAVWDNFIQAVSADTKCANVVNLIGSVDKFERMFIAAFDATANQLQHRDRGD